MKQKPGPKPSRPGSVEIRVTIDPDLKKTLELEAQADKRSLSSYVEQVLLRRKLS